MGRDLWPRGPSRMGWRASACARARDFILLIVARAMDLCVVADSSTHVRRFGAVGGSWLRTYADARLCVRFFCSICARVHYRDAPRSRILRLWGHCPLVN